MCSANLRWLFYKDYFKDIDYSKLDNPINEEKINKNIKNIINQSQKIENYELIGNIYFSATTTYPGMLLGSGNAHELPDIKGQAILGFHFDYTSGLPVIQGSSVKGVLRSAFKHTQYIQELLGDKNIDVKDLESNIFNNNDIFFDAVVSRYGTNLLGDDYITPHKNEFSNPTPLRFIKVMPKVTFRFEFTLSDYIVANKTILTQVDKALLFAQILADLGIGAKTNVGYGHFDSNLAVEAKREIENYKEEQKKLKDEMEKQKKDDEEAKKLESLDSNVEKIKFKIKSLTKNDTKIIFDIINEYELTFDEKDELIKHLIKQIDPKPATKKNKASVKWAIKIYELLEK
jgi:CRISPR-associated protein Cmr6